MLSINDRIVPRIPRRAFIKRHLEAFDDLNVVTRTTRSILSLIVIGGLLAPVAPPRAGKRELPEWVKPAVRYLTNNGYLDRDVFRPNRPMERSAFTALMKKTFGGGFSRTRGYVTAAEVSATLVRKVGRAPLADSLVTMSSPDGWSPEIGRFFGSEIVARELGLRHDRPTTEEAFEASASDPMRQADVVYAVWQAKTSPDTWSADALRGFKLQNYSERRRQVVQFALSLVGTPYVWGGEWPTVTPSGYPYGAQSAGGFDCSGFAWYVLRKKSSGWSPMNRPYAGWDFPERSSSQMAGATPRRQRLGYKELKPGDVVFFASGGRDAKPSAVYHAGIYISNGWMVHSSGSRAGISLGSIGPGSWWHDQLTFGRRVIR